MSQTAPTPSRTLTQPPPPRYRATAADVAAELGVDPALGLSSDEVARRLAEFGPNRLAEPAARPPWLRFVDQFRSGIVYILIGAAVLAAVVGDLKDPIVISVVLVINAVLGFIQEGKAETAMAALRQMLVTRVKVRRDGRVSEVLADDLVPGDVVLLEAGDRVPADGRLLVAAAAAADESALTGESVPVDKQVEPLERDELALGDRTNLVYMNTTLVRGRAEFVVTETGMRTEMGRVAELLTEADPGPTPLQRQLDTLGKRLAVIAIAAVTAVFLLQLVQGEALAEAALGAVALAVAAIPEGLPAVVTVTLAIGVSQMAKRNAIVKRLHSVETLGSTTVICSDKTGTLTLNQMTARAIVVGNDAMTISGEGYRPDGVFTPVEGATVPDLPRALLPAVLANDAVVRDGVLVGDPTEGALVVAAQKAGIDVDTERERLPRLGEVPFDSATKFMATFHRGHGPDEVVVFVKGAPDVLMDRAVAYVDPDHDGLLPLDARARAELEAANDRLASEGLRVLAVASRTVRAEEVLGPDGTVADPEAWIGELVIEALIGILDPPRAEAADAIAVCRSAGIDVKMITGDHAATAGAIAAALGIRGQVVTGDELTAMTDEELAARIDGIGVCARVSPEHKVRVVRALKANGHVVAMTGDGVNDAAALRSADIGVAMGITGTEVTKEAGDMVLTDDNFATIVGAVERGRTIYDNIVKFVRFQLTTNLGAIGTILTASLLGLPVPFTPIQVLWVNIIADGPPALSLGVDPPDRDIMARPPRPTDEAILGVRRIGRLLFFAAVMTAGTLGLYVYAEREWGEAVALTMAFNAFVFFQMFNVFNARSEHRSVFGRYVFSNPKLLAAVAVVAVLQLMAVKWGPMQAIFDTETLTMSQWAMSVAVASAVLWAEELRKFVVRLIPRRRP
jgi:Ca2+-transporting ATPase